MKKLLQVLALIGLAVFLVLACDLAGPDDGDQDGDGTVDDTQKTIEDAVLELPRSILPPIAQSIRRSAAAPENDISDLFSLIPQYVGTANDIRTFVVNLMGDVFAGSETLDQLTRDELTSVNYGRYQSMTISDLSGSEYDHKIVLYEDAGGTTAGMAIYYTMGSTEGTAKGKVLLEDSSETFYGTDPAVDKTVLGEILFDNMSSATETLTIRYYCDLTSLRHYATTNYSTPLSDTDITEIRSLDLSQPERLTLDVKFDGTDYFISGYSTHPGISELSDFELEEFHDIFKRDEDESGTIEAGEYRHTYLFKAHAQLDTNGEEIGAKVALAFPENDATSAEITTTWDNDAVGVFFTDYMVEFVNNQIQAETDIVDKNYYILWIKDLLPTIAENPTLEEARFNEYAAMVNELYTNIGDTTSGISLADVNTYYTGLSYADSTTRTTGAAVKREDIDILLAFAGVSLDYSGGDPVLTDTDVAALRATIENCYNEVSQYTHDEFDGYYGSLDDASNEKYNMLFGIYLPYMVDTAIGTGYEITKEELEAFFDRDDLDADAQAFRDLYQSVDYIVNPAFYHPDDGFFATLNEGDPGDAADDKLYVLVGDRLELDDGGETRDDPLLDLTLTSTEIEVLIPATESGYTITVQ